MVMDDFIKLVCGVQKEGAGGGLSDFCSAKKMVPEAPRQSPAQGGAAHRRPIRDLAGVGLTLKPPSNVADAGLEVVRVDPGGGCEKCGVVLVGDRLIAAAGVAVQGLRAHELGEILIGPVGSRIKLTFERASEDGVARMVVDVERSARLR